ncbi:MAG: helix-turn-helix domain-containing protein, partial [Treponema sp.]|nr:helix-turn-helix domain-containing protein [Treponema sp.]
QMKLAEMCDTVTSYIGEIEIERKFPSIDMAEKIAGALGVHAYTMFAPRRERTAAEIEDETAAALGSLSDEIKKDIAERLKLKISAAVDGVMNGGL